MYDLAIIGLGPSGLEALRIANENNLNVIVFEPSEPGGTCLNLGCIPTKAIVHCAQFYNDMKNSSKLGITLLVEPKIRWKTILDRKDEIVYKFRKALKQTLSKNVTLINKRASLILENNTVEICADDNLYRAKNIIIASGSKPRTIKGLEVDSKFIINSDDIFNFTQLPKSIAIIGSGAIGLEWAMIFSNFNVKVSLIEKEENLAPVFDKDIRKRVERILKLNNIDYYKNDYVVDIKNNTVCLNSNKKIEVDNLLVAAGRVPLLPKIQVQGCSEDYKLRIFNNNTTDIDNLFVTGDACGFSTLAHSAAFQAKNIMNKILFNKEPEKKDIPSVVFTNPEIASIGLREQDIEDFSNYRIKKVLMSSIAKSWCCEAQDGFIKVIIKDNIIKGAHIVSKEASILISLFCILIDRQININDIKDMIIPHPTLAEAIMEALRIE